MNEYQTLDIFSNTLNMWITLFTAYVSIVFAFLVAATLAVNRLNRVLSILAVALFSMTSFFFITTTAILGARVLEQLVAVGQFTSSDRASMAFPLAMTMLVNTITVLTYLGSVYFFIYQRLEKARAGAGRR